MLEYEDLLVVFDKFTNKNYYKILCDAKNNKILDYYNDKYNFNTDNKYKMLSFSIKLNYSNNNNLIKLIGEFIYDYTINFLQIKRISKKISNESILNVLNKFTDIKKEKILKNNINNKIDNKIEYEKKYIKYKLKYLELKKSTL